jgi:hypothetical protein
MTQKWCGFRIIALIAILLTFSVIKDVAAQLLYENGANITDGLHGGYFINTTYQFTNSFVLGSSATLKYVDFRTELIGIDNFTSVDCAITTTPFDTPIASGTNTPLTLTVLSQYNDVEGFATGPIPDCERYLLARTGRNISEQ